MTDLVRKISSRKFWAAVSAVVICLLALFNVDQLTVEKVVALIGAVGGLVSYIFAEAYVDGKRIESDK